VNRGTRIVVVGGPWDERIGCKGVVVSPPADGTYPQPAKNEVVVLLDDDHSVLFPQRRRHHERQDDRGCAGWVR